MGGLQAQRSWGGLRWAAKTATVLLRPLGHLYSCVTKQLNIITIPRGVVWMLGKYNGCMHKQTHSIKSLLNMQALYSAASHAPHDAQQLVYTQTTADLYAKLG